jgi:integrase
MLTALVKKVNGDKDRLKKVNPDITCHSFRRSFATLLFLKKKLPVSRIKVLMGHESIRTTERYIMNQKDCYKYLKKDANGREEDDEIS